MSEFASPRRDRNKRRIRLQLSTASNQVTPVFPVKIVSKHASPQCPATLKFEWKFQFSSTTRNSRWRLTLVHQIASSLNIHGNNWDDQSFSPIAVATNLQQEILFSLIGPVIWTHPSITPCTVYLSTSLHHRSILLGYARLVNLDSH